MLQRSSDDVEISMIDILNFLVKLSAKKIRKSFCICKTYDQKSSVPFFAEHGVHSQRTPTYDRRTRRERTPRLKI